jgi:wyosine [tRNA(Phe)-imidazoG37] synthetase (radical SAM superfamily)
MGTFLFDKIIFGPVKSRRLGISLGINLLPTNSKLCNFNCIYCECGWTNGKQEIKTKFHPRELVSENLEAMLIDMKEKNKPLDVITYAGNGEPTLHPDFNKIIDDTIRIRNKYFPKVRIAVLSNATLIHKEKVFSALNLIDDNVLKLDSAFIDTVRLFNNPIGKYDINNIVENFKKFRSNLTIQTMFVKGQYKGQKVDNTTEKELTAWIELLHKIKPKTVMIYTIARDTPSPDLVKVSADELYTIKDRLNKEGFEVQVSA